MGHEPGKSSREVKLAFSEFYLSLVLLQNYQTLNFQAFRKIAKKHDKVTVSFATEAIIIIVIVIVYYIVRYCYSTN